VCSIKSVVSCHWGGVESARGKGDFPKGDVSLENLLQPLICSFKFGSIFATLAVPALALQLLFTSTDVDISKILVYIGDLSVIRSTLYFKNFFRLS